MRVDRQRKRKRRPFPHFALDPDLAAVHFDEFSGQCQPEPSSLALLRVVAADLTEFLEDRFVIFRRDADAGVADRNNHRAVAQPRLDS